MRGFLSALCLIKLAVIKICVKAFCCKQLFVTALLDNIAILHNQNQVSILDSGKPVGNDKACSSLHQVIHSLLNLDLCSGIYRRSSLIQDQDLIVRQDCSCNGKKLFLALGNIAGLLVQNHLIAARLLHDKVVDVSRLCSCDHFLICGIQSSVTDVFHDGSGEQPGVLKNHSEHFVKLASIEIFYIMSVHTDGAAVYIIETHKKFDHSGLSGTGRSYNGNLLSVLYLCREIVDDDLIRIVAEVYMIKFYISIKAVNGDRILFLIFFLFLIQEFKHTLRSGC